MAAVDMRVDLAPLVDSVASGDIDQIIAAARQYLQQEKAADVLIGRIGMIAAHGDPDGHPLITLDAASMLGRLIHWIPAGLNESEPARERALPLFVQALKVAAPAVARGRVEQARVQYPEPFYPSELMDTGKTMNDVMQDAVTKNDALLAERALLGLYGTGADYRTMQVRAYESIATTFQNAGHPLLYAVRGFQLLDSVEWGDRAPNIIHWLAPHLPLHPNNDEPAWVHAVRSYTADPAHSVASIRTRLAFPKEENALPLRALILSDADTTQVCQGVYDALIKGGASPQGVGSVIALAAADVIQRVGDTDHDLFVRVAHGLLFAAAARLVFRQVQDVEVLSLLFTSAAYVNALQKEVAVQPDAAQHRAPGRVASVGGGLIATSQLEALSEQLKAQDFATALATAQRYIRVGHDPRALFGAIGLAASWLDATADQGHGLQIVQAASEEFLAWPTALATTNYDAFLHVALRAALFGQRDPVTSQL